MSLHLSILRFVFVKTDNSTPFMMMEENVRVRSDDTDCGWERVIGDVRIKEDEERGRLTREEGWWE